VFGGDGGGSDGAGGAEEEDGVEEHLEGFSDRVLGELELGEVVFAAVHGKRVGGGGVPITMCANNYVSTRVS